MRDKEVPPASRPGLSPWCLLLQVKGCKAEDAVALGINEGFHEAARLGKCLSAEDCNHRSLRQSVGDAALLRFRLAQTDAGKLRVREHAKRHLPGGGRAMSAKNIVMHDVEIIFRDVREMRAAGTFARGPNIGRCCLEAFADFYVPMPGCFHACQLQANAMGVGSAARRYQDMGTFHGC